MAEAFGFYVDNLLTKDHFTEVLNARFAEQDARIEATIDARFARQDRILLSQSWMLGLLTLTTVVPKLIKWFS